MQGAVDLTLEGLKIALHDIVEIDQLKVKVVDHFSRSRPFGEEKTAAPPQKASV